MRETESFLLAARNNAIKTKYIKARIEKIQQNSKCRYGNDRDKTINHTISECSKLEKKEYKTRHDWMGNAIHWEQCKKFKLNGLCKMVYAKPIIDPREYDAHNSLGF